MTSVIQSPHVHALLIGINEYQDALILHGNGSFPKLSGCAHDACQMLKYLQNDPTITLSFKLLLDQEATKLNIIDAFRKDLSLATENDTILIYYSGHGTVEEADPSIWVDESDGRLESIVCYYEDTYSPNFLLADKEIRYLLHELYQKTGAHIVTIFDCCNSGDNTRSQVTPTINNKRIDIVFFHRNWDDFIFAAGYKHQPEGSKSYDLADFKGKILAEVLPQAAHVQLSAAESDEAAVESNGEGVLTSYLLRTLEQSGGNLSYAELHSRVRNKIRGIFDQKPKLYAPNEYHHLLQTGFLNKEITEVQDGTIVFSTKTGAAGRWVLNRGVIHGVANGKTTVVVAVNKKETLTGKVVSTDLDSAVVQFENEEGLEVKDHRVKISGTEQRAILLRLINKDAPVEEVEKVLKELELLEAENWLTFCDEAHKAAYDLVLANGLIYITLPDNEFQPLTKQLYLNQDGTIKLIGNCLRHISHWTYLKQLNNATSNKLPDHYLQVTFAFEGPNGGQDALDPGPENELKLKIRSLDGGKTWGGKLKINITNNGPVNLYIAAIYFDPSFAAQAGLLEPKVSMLKPNDSVRVFSRYDGIPLQLDPKWYWYNWEKEDNYINFIYSTAPFSAEQLEKAALPSPLYPGTEDLRAGFNLGNFPIPGLTEGWSVKSYKIVFANPTFDQNNEEKLAGLRELESTLI